MKLESFMIHIHSYKIVQEQDMIFLIVIYLHTKMVMTSASTNGKNKAIRVFSYSSVFYCVNIYEE